MKEIWLNIQNYEDRKNVVWVLSCAGYRVRVEEEVEVDTVICTLRTRVTYWVITEVPDNNIKNFNS